MSEKPLTTFFGLQLLVLCWIALEILSSTTAQWHNSLRIFLSSTNDFLALCVSSHYDISLTSYPHYHL